MVNLPPHHRPWVRVALIPGAWLLYSVVMMFQTYLPVVREGKSIALWIGVIFPCLVYSGLWLILTYAVLWLAERFPLEHPRLWRNITLHSVASIVFAVGQKITSDVITIFLQASPAEPPNFHWLFRSVVGFFDYGLLMYWVILLVHQGLEYAHRIQDAQVRTARLETQLAETRLEALRNQLKPHFLFNTLNSISALMEEDPRAADTMIARLGDFLRLTLENAGAPFIVLEREMESLKTYVAIERTRFQDNLELELDIEPAALSALIPSFLWQPLVENAIQHGIATSGGKGRIIVRARTLDHRLQLQVQDNGNGLSAGSRGEGGIQEGIGLNTTRSILRHLYGDEQRITLEDVAEGGAVVTLEIPFVTTTATATGAHDR